MNKLDRIDLKILSVLQAEGRITNSALAEKVGLSASPCLQRVKRLEQSGLILGYGAQVDLARLGPSITVFTEFTLTDHRRQDFAAFEALIHKTDQVVECHLISGGYDYLVKFICRDLPDYQNVIEDLLETSGGVEKYFSYVVIKSPMPARPPFVSIISAKE